MELGVVANIDREPVLTLVRKGHVSIYQLVCVHLSHTDLENTGGLKVSYINRQQCSTNPREITLHLHMLLISPL
jgi:hypothetical protein